MVQSFFFCFYSTPAYGAPLDVDLDLLEDMASNPEKYEPASMKLTEFLVRSVTGGQALDKFFGTSSQELISNIKALFSKEGNCKTDGNNYYLTQNFTNEFNKAVQGKVHALDGYYLIEPKYNLSYSSLRTFNYISSDWSGTNSSSLNASLSRFTVGIQCGRFDQWYLYNTNKLGFYVTSGELRYYVPDGVDVSHNWTDSELSCATALSLGSDSFSLCDKSSSYYYAGGNLAYMQNAINNNKLFGLPFKLFYSLQDAKNYFDNGQKRTYAPKLPNVTIKIPVKYINNSVSLPDITYNITTENKTEVEIQNQYDTTIKNYLDNLDNFTDGTDPTPTPKPDGGFTDGTTPTPKPDFGDGSDPTDTNDWLKKIYEWLQSFGDTHSKFEKAITDYIEVNNGKLDQIIEAINALSDGKTEDEKNGCKYDFTALSDFMTKLWNESDKKFDKMVELLEENNKYQKKLVNSLNEIKAILVTQTIMDVFQDRSQQTAEKAKDKFPTSLPWDIALVVNAMSAEPEKPQFDLPIQIKSLNINEEIHVDLATGEWEKLAKTCRYLLSILFILLLVQLSRKLFSNGGND